jgi:hypothetical protein
MAPAASAGFKLTHTPYWKLTLSLKSARQSIQGKRFSALGLEKRFFQATGKNVPENAMFPRTLDFFVTKMNGDQPQTRTRRTRQP